MKTANERLSSSSKKRRHDGEKGRETSGTGRKITPTATSGGNDDDDEIRLLRDFLEITKEFPSPQTGAAILFERAGKSLRVEITHSQLIDKLNKLRDNYAKQALEKHSIKTLSSRDRAIFEISHEIWGSGSAEVAIRNSFGSEKVRESPKNTKKKKKKKDKLVEVETLDKGKNVRVGHGGVDVVGLEKKYAYLTEEVSRLPGNYEAMMRDGLKLMDVSSMERLNREWRLQQVKEAKFLAERDGFVEKVKRLLEEAIECPSRD